MSNIKFVEAGESESGKTKKWSVQNLTGTVLGEISWKAQWRRYWYVPAANVGLDAGCLCEVADFMIDETEKQKEGA